MRAAICATDGERRAAAGSSLRSTKRDADMKNLEAETTTNQSVSIKKILVAVDLSDHSKATVSHAAEIAEIFGASLTVVHVHEPVALYECASETTYTLLDDQRCNLLKRL